MVNAEGDGGRVNGEGGVEDGSPRSRGQEGNRDGRFANRPVQG